MSKTYHINLPLSDKDISKLKAGDIVFLSGELYTARDAAHKKIIDLIKNGEKPPFDLSYQTIYFVGPTPAKEGEPIGSAGPTTSYRMDPYSVELIKNQNLKGMIGKGFRSDKVKEACQKYKAVYFGATGGAGALLSKKIIKAEVVAYPELESEAVRKLTVKEFPVTVVNDIYGNDLYKTGRGRYQLKYCNLNFD